MYVRFYNKTMEQLSKLGSEPAVGVDVNTWVRCELSASGDNADALGKMISRFGFQVVPGVLLTYLDCKEVNENDTDISRWPSVPSWAGFLGSLEKQSLGVAPAVPTLEKAGAWVRKQVGVTLALMVEAAGGLLDELVSIIQEGRRFRANHRVAHINVFGVGGAGASGGAVVGLGHYEWYRNVL